ncbi:lactonase family protein [Nesterenkonia suensis]
MFVRNDRGSWALVHEMRDLVNPSYLVVSEAQNILYTVHGDSQEVSALEISSDGSLAVMNTVSSNGLNPVHLALSPDERYLCVVNYASGNVASIAIAQDGSLGDVVCVRELRGSPGPHRAEQPSSRPHQVVFDASGAFVLVPDKGLDRTWVFRFDKITGQLLPNSFAWSGARSGAGPRHLVEHDELGVIYIVNELDCTISVCDWDSTGGRLEARQIVTLLPDDYTGNGSAAGVVLDVERQRVYASIRHMNGVCAYEIIPSSGLLANPSWVDSCGVQPRFISLDNFTGELLVANELSGEVRAVSLASSGTHPAFDPSGGVVRAHVSNPVCIEELSR